MSLSEKERLVIVRRELEKADRTYDDVVFCANEHKWDQDKTARCFQIWSSCAIMPTIIVSLRLTRKSLCRTFSQQSY